jgi:hypothetical protein
MTGVGDLAANLREANEIEPVLAQYFICDLLREWPRLCCRARFVRNGWELGMGDLPEGANAHLSYQSGGRVGPID